MKKNSSTTILFRPTDPVKFSFQGAAGRIPVMCPLSLVCRRFRARFRLRFRDSCGFYCCSRAKSVGTNTQHNSNSGCRLGFRPQERRRFQLQQRRYENDKATVGRTPVLLPAQGALEKVWEKGDCS